MCANRERAFLDQFNLAVSCGGCAIVVVSSTAGDSDKSNGRDNGESPSGRCEFHFDSWGYVGAEPCECPASHSCGQDGTPAVGVERHRVQGGGCSTSPVTPSLAEHRHANYARSRRRITTVANARNTTR